MSAYLDLQFAPALLGLLLLPVAVALRYRFGRLRVGVVPYAAAWRSHADRWATARVVAWWYVSFILLVVAAAEPVRVADFLIEKDPLFARINLDRDEFQLYQKVYRQLTIDAPRPDLVIYLQASPDVLLGRIENRGISAERTIDRDYLERLNEVYSEFFLYYDDAPLLIVNASELDLANNDADYIHLVEYLLEIRSGRHYFNPTFFG